MMPSGLCRDHEHFAVSGILLSKTGRGGRRASSCGSVLLYFACDFACSRCWRAMVELGDLHGWLRKRHTSIVVLGPERHLEGASSLAKELGLPFELASDRDLSLRAALSIRPTRFGRHQAVTLLLDGYGEVRYRRSSLPDGSIDFTDLKAAVKLLDTVCC